MSTPESREALRNDGLRVLDARELGRDISNWAYRQAIQHESVRSVRVVLLSPWQVRIERFEGCKILQEEAFHIDEMFPPMRWIYVQQDEMEICVEESDLDGPRSFAITAKGQLQTNHGIVGEFVAPPRAKYIAQWLNDQIKIHERMRRAKPE